MKMERLRTSGPIRQFCRMTCDRFMAPSKEKFPTEQFLLQVPVPFLFLKLIQ